ncbi:MAG TPA: FecR domain-containing protein [Steroidobacteraceae bacterium]|nr:FecR domain-containing protein [Steroidobacteraceae bacterium]
MSNEKDPLATLISQAGARQRPSDAMEASVRAVAYEAWQQSLRHERRQRVMWLSSAAAIVIAMVGAWYVASRVNSPSPVLVATLVQAKGHVNVARPNNDSHDSISASRIYTGEEINTGDGTALLSLNGKANIRLARHTRLRWQSASKIMLASGKIYVDSGAQFIPLSINTTLGTVTHLGTRYQVVSSTDNLDVSVRDGMVIIVTPRSELQLQSRQAVSVTASGGVTHHDIDSHGAQWEWADNLAPQFQFDNHNLAEFLEWVAHETGHSLQYNDAITRTTATQTMLHVQGMTESVTPMAALSMVLPTTDFDVHFSDGQLIVNKLNPNAARHDH